MSRTSPSSCTSTTTATCQASPRTSSTAASTHPAAAGPRRPRLAEICTEVHAAIEAGARLIVLSDRGPATVTGGTAPGGNTVPIPSLLLTGAVHHHLIREKTRTRVGLIVETGDARECHHIALLIGYGAGAVCPYLAIETVRDLAQRGELNTAPAAGGGGPGHAVLPDRAEQNLIKALGKGLLK